MTILNSTRGYGALTKLFHWLIVFLFVFQYLSATIMLRTPDAATTLGVGQDTYFNWHKSLGLVALAVAVVRLANRSVGQLPPWAPTLTTLEQIIIHRVERLLYAAMFIMPLSGFLYVMAGGYGVVLFGLFELPNPIPASAVIASIAKWVHVASAMLLLLPLGTHLGLVLGHHFGLKDRLIDRILPGRSLSPKASQNASKELSSGSTFD
jgi:cytochrome b561